MGSAISVTDLHKSYGDKEVLKGISLAVEQGEVFGLLGPNGAGKTTALESIIGLRLPTSGSVRVLELNPATERRAITQLMAVQPQAAALFPTLTTWETLQLFASFYKAPRDPAEILAEVELDDARHTRVKHLSGGQQRRLLIGVALFGNPRILVLDEPSAGLDPAARHNLWTIIRRQQARGATILLSTHHMDEAAQVCDRVAILVDGVVVARGAPDDLIREHSGTANVTFVLTAPTTAAELAALGVSGEISTTEQGTMTRVSVITDDPDAVLRKLTFTPKLGSHSFNVRHNSLEDFYLDATNSR